MECRLAARDESGSAETCRARSSVGQSASLITTRSLVRLQPGPVRGEARRDGAEMDKWGAVAFVAAALVLLIVRIIKGGG